MSGALDNKETDHLGNGYGKKKKDDINDRSTHRWDGTPYYDIDWI